MDWTFYAAPLGACAAGTLIAVGALFRTGQVIPSLYQQPVTRGVPFRRVVFAYLFNIPCSTILAYVLFAPITVRQWIVAAMACVTIAGDKKLTRPSAGRGSRGGTPPGGADG